MLFTSMYFFEILNNPWKTPLIREQLSRNASWFSYARTQFSKNWVGKKIQKHFIVSNNNKRIRVWYLSSKWPVCRLIVNQTNGGASRTKLSTFLPSLKQISFNIVSCFAIKWLKYACNKGILPIQIMDKCFFVFFRNFFPFNWKAKLGIYYFLLLFFLTKQLRYATYGLETCCSYLGSITHNYISMVKETISAFP